MKLINHNLTQTLTSGNAKVEMINDVLSFSLDDTYYVDDRATYITSYCYRLGSLSFDSVLVGGLGLGLIPYHLKNNLNITDIDVVENNSGVVSIVNQLGYLNESVDIITADATSYSTVKTYDLIVMDLWWFDDETFINEKQAILNNYSSNLTANGKFYFPLIDEII